jgi:predicted dehydrogenase
VIHYRVNAGRLESSSWYANAALEGRRFIAEGCHFVDTISWWIGSDPVEVSAAGAPDDEDNLVASFRYPDGSLGIVSYLTSGDARYSKELIEVFGQGMVGKLTNFQKVEVWRHGRPTTKRALLRVDKGQRGELEAFLGAIRRSEAMPIPLASLLATTRATFAAISSATDKVPRDIPGVTSPVSGLDIDKPALGGASE